MNPRNHSIRFALTRDISRGAPLQVRFRRGSRRCVRNVQDLFRYRAYHFLDSFRLQQSAKGKHAFRTPLAKLAENSSFNFRDATTREFTVNVVALCSLERAVPGWPDVLRRPLFDVDRVEAAADPLARIVVRGALGRFSLDVDPDLAIDCPEFLVGDAVDSLVRERTDPEPKILEELFYQDPDHLGLLDLIAATVVSGWRPPPGLSLAIERQVEAWAHRTLAAVENVTRLQAWYRDYFGGRHRPCTAALRLERTLPALETRRRVEAWRASAALLQAASDILKRGVGSQVVSLKREILFACEHPERGVSPGSPVGGLLEEVFSEALAAVYFAGQGEGRLAYHDRQAVYATFGSPSSEKAQRQAFCSLYQVVRGLPLPAELPEVDFVQLVRDETKRDLSETLRDWLGFSAPETVSYHTIERFF